MAMRLSALPRSGVPAGIGRSLGLGPCAGRSAVVLALLALPLAAQDGPERGPIPVATVPIGSLAVPVLAGGPDEALQAYLEAHARDKAGDGDAALEGYVRFFGIPGRHELPARYVQTAQRRLDARRAEVRALYDAATKEYEADRARGLRALDALARRFPALPEGKAARALHDTDRLRAAIDAARALARDGKRADAARDLERAVRSHPEGLFLYEAKSLLVELGGPDLFDPGERVGSRGEAEEGKGERDDEDDGSSIEIGDGG
jgi:hypothetical protein